MRTSNKILLGVFVAIILLLTGLHAALRIQYERGHIVVLDDSRIPKPVEGKAFGNIRHVQLTGLIECTIGRDTTAWAVVSDHTFRELNVQVKGDTLFVDGRLSEKEYEQGRRNHLAFELQLPDTVSITARYSNVRLVGAMDAARAGSRDVVLQHSELNLWDPGQGDVYWKQFVIAAEKSTVYLRHNAVLQDVQIRLADQCTFVDNNARMDRFSLQADSTSSARLNGVNLKKAHIITK